MTTDEFLMAKQKHLTATAVRQLRQLAEMATKLADGLETRGIEAHAVGGGLGDVPSKAQSTLDQLSLVWEIQTR